MSQIILNSPEVVENESEAGVRLEINELESYKKNSRKTIHEHTSSASTNIRGCAKISLEQSYNDFNFT